MTLRPLLLLCALLSGSVLAQGASPASVPVLPQIQVQRLDPDQLSAEVARSAPAYGGSYPKDGVLYVFVTSLDPAQRQAAVRELFALQGESLRRRGFSPSDVVFLPGWWAAGLLLVRRAARSPVGIMERRRVFPGEDSGMDGAVMGRTRRQAPTRYARG